MAVKRPGLTWLLLVSLAAAPLSLAYYIAGYLQFMGRGLRRGEIMGGDFINYWTGSHLLINGRIFDIFNPTSYSAALRRIWGSGLALHSFSYPPSIFPFIVWTGALPYRVAFALWSVSGIVALLAAAWPHSRSPFVAAAILVSPAVLACLGDGQNGLLTAALLIGGWRLIDRRPWLSGVLIGLVTFKPQLGLLIPIALFAAGRWRTIGGAAASAIALVAAGFFFTGEAGWALYLSRTLAFQGRIVKQGHGMWRAMTPSPLSAGLTAGLPQSAAYAIQAACTLVVAALIFTHFRKLKTEGRRIGAVDVLILMTSIFVASPYSFNYDMPSVTLALVLACTERPDLDGVSAWRWGVATLWIAPIVMVIFGVVLMAMGVFWLPIGAVMTMSGLALVWLGSRNHNRMSLTWPSRSIHSDPRV